MPFLNTAIQPRFFTPEDHRSNDHAKVMFWRDGSVSSRGSANSFVSAMTGSRRCLLVWLSLGGLWTMHWLCSRAVVISAPAIVSSHRHVFWSSLRKLLDTIIIVFGRPRWARTYQVVRRGLDNLDQDVVIGTIYSLFFLKLRYPYLLKVVLTYFVWVRSSFS